MTFRPYQIEGAKFLASKRYALLADDPGLGKTAQSVRACDAIGARTVAVVCPASVVLNWRREFDRWWPDWLERPLLYVESYDKVARHCWREPNFDLLIVDEAHYAKTPTAARTKALYGKSADGSGLVSKAKRTWLLTGTPAPNNPAEL